MTKFSVNLNKFALLRNSRGHNNPDLMAIAARCIARGVDGITVHPRPDERHTRLADVASLAGLLAGSPQVEFNVEGYPSPQFIELILKTRPHQCTLVPDEPGQLTSDHGWDAVARKAELRRVIGALAGSGVRVSVFLDPVVDQVEAVKETGAHRIELYTESYAAAVGEAAVAGQLTRFAAAATRAAELGLGVNAGHDLNQRNLGRFLKAVPHVLEVSIGHAVVCESFDHGLEDTLDAYLAIVRSQGA